MATTKANGRKLVLAARQTKVTNLNFSPEKAGKDQEREAVDMSLGFIVEDFDIQEVVSTKSNVLKTFWDSNGGVNIRDLDSLALSITCEGTAEFGVTDEQLLEFPGAKLKKVSVTPMHDRKLEVRCQVRVYPEGQLEDLGLMRINKTCVFSFEGEGVATGDKNKDQGKLEV